MAVDLAAIRSRVRETGLFLVVGDATGLADAQANSPPQRLPAAYVMVPAESGRKEPVTGVYRTRITARVSVAFVIQSQRHDGLSERSDELEAIRTVLKDHLAGWKPSRDLLPLDYVTSAIVGDTRGYVWATLQFETAYVYTPAGK